jgi:hypothetical protein
VAEEATTRARYVRQIVLTGVGEEGQSRIAQSVARVPREGLAGEIARAYATRAGCRAVEDGPAEAAPSFVETPAARDVVSGSLAALREIVRALDSDR